MRRIRSAAVVLLLGVGTVIASDPGAATASSAVQSSIQLKRNDYNRDGVSDLVGVRHSDGCLARWKGNGAGRFTYIGDAGCGWGDYSYVTAAGDITGDGVGDLVGIRQSDGCLARWKGTGNFGFAYIGDVGCGWRGYHPLVGAGDINGDGVGDLMAVRFADSCLARWLGNARGGFTYIGDYDCRWSAIEDMTGIGDVNRDGNADFLATFTASSCAHTYAGNGYAAFSLLREYCYTWTSHGQAVGMGDMNRDGIGDVVAVNRRGCLESWFGDGQGGFPYGGSSGCGWEGYALA